MGKQGGDGKHVKDDAQAGRLDLHGSQVPPACVALLFTGQVRPGEDVRAVTCDLVLRRLGNPRRNGPACPVCVVYGLQSARGFLDCCSVTGL